mgnify:FL=1
MTTEYLMKREMEHVFAALTPGNRLVCRVAVHTGLRVGDVLAIPTAKLGRQFWITEKKTGKRRRVNLPGELVEAIKAQAGPEWAFPGARSQGKPRTRQAVWADVKRAAKAFRMPQNVGVHSLRKRYAVEQLERSKGNYARVQRLLNHADIATTMIYAMSYQLYQAKYGESEREK